MTFPWSPGPPPSSRPIQFSEAIEASRGRLGRLMAEINGDHDSIPLFDEWNNLGYGGIGDPTANFQQYPTQLVVEPSVYGIIHEQTLEEYLLWVLSNRLV